MDTPATTLPSQPSQDSHDTGVDLDDHATDNAGDSPSAADPVEAPGVSDDELHEDDFSTYNSRFDVPEDTEDEDCAEDHQGYGDCHRPHDDPECEVPDPYYADHDHHDSQ